MWSLSVCGSLTFLVVLFLLYLWAQRRIRRQEKSMDVEIGNGYAKITNQDEDIWNISSRVNQQGRGPIATQPGDWPTHDHHLSLESFVLPPEKDNRPAPPPYSELDLPSYEQATGCRPPKPDLVLVHSTSRHERDLVRSSAGPSS